MKQYSYKDIKLLRQIYKSNLDLLYQNVTQQRIDKLTGLLNLIITILDIPFLAQQLNTSGDIQLTASLQILKVKCGMYKQFSVQKLAETIQALLYLFTKYLKNYTRKIKESKYEINQVEFYAQSLASQQYFLIYVSYFKLLLPKFQSQIKNQTKIEQIWCNLISNMINNLKKTEQQRSVYKSVTIIYQICTDNSIFKKQVVKNGILQYLINFVERCEVRWLVTQCIKLIQLLTQQKQIAKLLIQQQSEDVFFNIANKFKNEQLKNKITGIMNNVIKYGQPQTLNQIVNKAKVEVNNLQKSQNQTNLDKSMNHLKLYSLSNNFTKVLSNSNAHKWLSPLLTNQKVQQKIQLSTLDVFQSILKNKQNYKAADEVFITLNKPLTQTFKNPKTFQKLNAYLRILATGLKKDCVNKQYIKKLNLNEWIEKFMKRQEGQIQRLCGQIMTLMDLKQGKIKCLPLQVNRKSKDIKQLQKLNNYLDNVVNLNLLQNIKKQQIETLSDFLDIHENDYPNQNEEQLQTNIKNIKKKILSVIKSVFSNKSVIQKLSTQKLLNNLINSLQGSDSLKQSLQLIQLILHSCSNLVYNKQKTLDIVQKIQKNNQFNQQTISSCGQILYYMDSINITKQLFKTFKNDFRNNQYLQKLAACLSTTPDQIQKQDQKQIKQVLQILQHQKLEDLSDETIQNLMIILIRIAKISNIYKQQIRKKKKLLSVFQQKMNKPNLKIFALQLFSNLIEVQESKINTLNTETVANPSYISPISQLYQRVLEKVINQNKYTNIELKFIQKMIDYQKQIILEKVKLKNHQLIYQAGRLFAFILQNNKIQKKKLPLVVQQLQKQIDLGNKNLYQILVFFSQLKKNQKNISIKNIFSIIKTFSKDSMSKFELYPENFQILDLALKVLQKSIQNSQQSDSLYLSELNVVLKQLLKLFYVDKKQDQIYKKQVIQGKPERNQIIIQNIYSCLHKLSIKIDIKYKQNELLIKYAQNSTNSYILYQMAGIVQNSNFEQLNAIKSKLKTTLKKYPNVKNLIDFDKKNQQRGFTNINNNNQENEQLLIKQQNKNIVVNNEKLQNIPVKKVEETKEVVILTTEALIIQLNKIITNQKSNYSINTILDLITQKNPKIYQLLLKIYIKYQNQKNNSSQQIKAKIISKIGQQNIQTNNSLFQMFQNHPQSLKLLQKVKITGETALEFGIRIFRSHNHYASRIIQYNLNNQNDYKIIQQHKIPQITYQIYCLRFKQVQIARFLSLMIGTAAKSKQIQLKFFKLGMHKKVIQALNLHKNQIKVVGNCFYALAGLAFCLEQLTKFITIQQNINLFSEILKIHQAQSSVVQSGSCLISNLCYHNQQSKKIFLVCGIIDVTIQLFKIHLQKKDYKGSTFKQILRVLGNCSLLIQNAKKIVSLQFIPLSINLIQLVNYNEDLQVLRYIVQVYSNLSSHTDNDYKLYLSTMFKQGCMDVLLTLLQTQILNTDIIGACIDAVDGLSQDKQIERYAVNKKIILLLIDILKSHQWNQKIVIKGIRVVSNLTLDKQFIIKILQANFTSIMANILANRKLQKSKLSLYTIKIITRIFNAKIKTQIILRSGYIECVLESLKKQTELFSDHLDILIYYSKEMTQYVNKKTYMIIIPLLQRFIFNDSITNKIVVLLKIIDKDVQIQTLIPYLVKIYITLINHQKDINNNFKNKLQQLLTLLISYCSKSHNLRAILRQKNFIDSLISWKKIVLQQQGIINQVLSVTIFVILNTYVQKPVFGVTMSESEQFLKRGIQCKMYRRDSSSKKAMINMNNQYQIRGFKYPDGDIKQKYRLHILSIKDFMFGYQSSTKIWQVSVFGGSGGIFQKSAEAKNCCTIIGPVTKIGAIIFNLEFASQNQKQFFEKNLFNLIRCLRQK